MTEPIAQTMPSPSTYAPGAFVWHDHISRDVAAAKRFYGELLGWTFQEVPMGEGHAPYNVITVGRQQIGGMMQLPECEAWVGYISVPDVDAAAKAAQATGGRVLTPPQDIPNVGRFATLSDPQGALIDVFRHFQGDPDQQQRPEVGEICWDDLRVADVKGVESFYHEVIGWNLAQAWGTTVFKMGDAAEASISRAPAGFTPRWVPLILVADLAAARKKAISLGGKILVEQASGDWGESTLVEDPLGVAFSLHPKMD